MKSTKRKQSIYVRCATVIQFTRLPWSYRLYKYIHSYTFLCTPGQV